MADENNNQEQGNGQQNQDQGQGGGQDAGNQGGDELTFDKWFATQADDIKSLLEDHTAGLSSALRDERSERKRMASQIRELSKTAEAGSELQKQLETLTGQMSEADTKATFYEGAHEAGVKNLRLAWIAAKEFDLVGKDGAVDFTQLKTVAPELFATQKTTPPPANAGSGANQNGMAAPNMNQWMRAAAGRG